VALEILRAHGGRITVESQLGEGAAFTLWLRS
jgi:signal transduction histidine kinase